MRISDWSSDVCSSDLVVRPHQRFAVDILLQQPLAHHQPQRTARAAIGLVGGLVDDMAQVVEAAGARRTPGGEPVLAALSALARKSVVAGTRVSVRVDLGVRRSMKKKNNKQKST